MCTVENAVFTPGRQDPAPLSHPAVRVRAVSERPAAVGRVLGTDDATPLEFWVALAPDQYLQLDDVVVCERTVPGGTAVRLSGVVAQVRARHEGARFDSDVFLISDGVLPAEVSEAAQVLTTRVEPEVYVPPHPGAEVRRAAAAERDEALYFDRMERRLPIGLGRDGLPLYANLDFLDGTRGAHVNISGVSGVATKTTYATFLLYSLFHSGVLDTALNTKALIFNVKGEDLLFLDHDNARLDERERERYRSLGLVPGPFTSVSVFAPARVGDRNGVPDVATRDQGVDAYWWTLEELCHDELLPFVFADAEDDRYQYTTVIHQVARRLHDAVPIGDGGVRIEGTAVRSYRELVALIEEKVTQDDERERRQWAGPNPMGTVNAFVRRLVSSIRALDRLVRADLPTSGRRHSIDTGDAQVTVVDLHTLPERAQRFVVGVTLRRTFDEKERTGQRVPLLFVVLDELNKYAPREGTSPIKEILLDVAERGRSLGIVLVGAQQTASEVERRVIANSALRVVGRLDPAEAARPEYGFLPAVHQKRATIAKPGTMFVTQPEIPVPLVVEFPFPAWATRPDETKPGAERRAAARGAADPPDDDPFAGFPRTSR
jgi:DNA helicase HerA-like ATPase